jgi:hypothetical protein
MARRWDSGLAWKDVTPSESVSLLLGSDEGGKRFSQTRYTTVGSPNEPFHRVENFRVSFEECFDFVILVLFLRPPFFCHFFSATATEALDWTSDAVVLALMCIWCCRGGSDVYLHTGFMSLEEVDCSAFEGSDGNLLVSTLNVNDEPSELFANKKKRKKKGIKAPSSNSVNDETLVDDTLTAFRKKTPSKSALSSKGSDDRGLLEVDPSPTHLDDEPGRPKKGKIQKNQHAKDCVKGPVVGVKGDQGVVGEVTLGAFSREPESLVNASNASDPKKSKRGSRARKLLKLEQSGIIVLAVISQ